MDESTLRKARERVERRLRKKTEAGVTQDDQRERMLKRARILAAEGVRKRQQEWQHRQTGETSPAFAAADAAAPQESAGAQAINLLADQLLSPETTSVETTDYLLDAAAEATSLQSAPELEDTISEAPLMDSTASMPSAEEAGIGSAPPASAEQNPIMEQSKVIAIGARADQPNEDPEGGFESDVDDQPGAPSLPFEAKRNFGKVKTGGLMRFFQAVAWLILVAGMGGAVLSWITLTDVQAGTQLLGSMNTSNLSMALLLGFAYLAIGVLGFAFFWVTSLIGGQLTEIRRILLGGSHTI